MPWHLASTFSPTPLSREELLALEQKYQAMLDAALELHFARRTAASWRMCDYFAKNRARIRSKLARQALEQMIS